jgi:hypothetical protein
MEIPCTSSVNGTMPAVSRSNRVPSATSAGKLKASARASSVDTRQTPTPVGLMLVVAR